MMLFLWHYKLRNSLECMKKSFFFLKNVFFFQSSSIHYFKAKKHAIWKSIEGYDISGMVISVLIGMSRLKSKCFSRVCAGYKYLHHWHIKLEIK